MTGEQGSGADKYGNVEPGSRRRRFRVARGLGKVSIVMALLVAVFAAAGFLSFVQQVRSPQAALSSDGADAIVVLTGGKDRIATAMALLEHNAGKRLLISGVHPDSSPGSIRRAVQGSGDLFDCCIDFDKAALDTVGNAESTARWVAEHGFKSLIVVTSDYHMPRSLIELRRKAGNVTLIPLRVQTLPDDLVSNLADGSVLRTLLPEYLKYMAARVRLGVRESETRTAIASAIAF